MNYRGVKISILVMLLISMLIVPAFANEKIDVGINSSRILNLDGVERIAVANPEIADVVVVSGAEVLLVGKTAGTTTMHIWSQNGRSSYTVDVTERDILLANEIKTTLGLSNIKVIKTGKTIVIEGKVLDANQKKRAEMMASAYGEKVVNLLEIVQPIQVKIEARIIEIDKNKVDKLGLTWGMPTPGSFTFGQSSFNSFNPNSFGKMGTFSPINGQLDALIKNGAGRILSKPNMVTISGEKASILVGGEIPLAVAYDNKDNRITYEYKEYGIKLNVEPVVNSEGLINSKVIAEVSSLDWGQGYKFGVAGISIPAIKKSKAETVIALASGQTMAIGGLISSVQSNDVLKVPFLGDLPVIGPLFRSKSFNKSETELIVLLTPTIVDPESYVPKSNELTPEINSAMGELDRKDVTTKTDNIVKK